jgi:hypothetical protein
VPSRRGDFEYFRTAIEGLPQSLPNLRLSVNTATGSLLFEGDVPEPEEVADRGRTIGLFELAGAVEAVPLMARMLPPVRRADGALRELSGGTVDLPSAVFLALIAGGAYQILRGRLPAPPWYTAFWYAFGLLTMFVLNKGAPDGCAESSD